MKLVKFTNLYTLIFGILLSACLFFFLPNTSQACDLQISPQTLGFRASGILNPPPQPEGWFQEDNKPFLYVDFKTENGCNSGTLYLTIFGLPENGGFSDSSFNYVVENQPINLALLDQTGGGSVAFRPDEKPCYGDNSDTSTSDCFIVAMFTDLPYQNPDAVIKGMIGNMIGGISLPEGTLFANQFGPQGYNQPTQGCVNTAGYFFQTYDPIGDNGEANPNPGCPSAIYGFGNSFNQKLINYYNSEFGGSFTFLGPGPVSPDTSQPVVNPTSDYTRARIIYPGFIYSCEGNCAFYDPWTSVDNGAVIPFGAIFPNDTGPIIVDPLPSNYQEEYIPLAPLPFEGLNGGSTPTLGEYLASIFRMGIVVVVILAVLMIVFHGIALAVTASAGKKSDHKDGVKNAIFGLLLAMGSWLLLNTINPQLASDLGIGIPNVTLEGDAESISTSPTTTSTGTITGLTLPTDLNLYCPLGGGSSSVANIIDSFDNKVTYRWGGKGSDLPPGSSFPMSPNESNSGEYMCSQNGQSVPCRNFCPENSVCLDCSGFVNHVRKCAGFSIYGGTSSMTQNQNAIPVDMDTLSSNGQSLNVNGSSYTLQPGDILVWNGHVVIYYGNGIIAESKGDISSIKNPNQNIKKTNLAQSSYRNKITHLIKANP